MPIRKYKPTSPGRRFQTVQTFDEITSTEPHKPLIEPLHADRRPRQPRRADLVVARRRPQAELPDHRLQARQARTFPATVSTVEYDPNRSARIALLTYADGEKRYILHPIGLDGRDDDRGRRQRRHPAGQLAAAEEHPARHAWSTTSSCGPAAAARSRAARVGRPGGGQGRRVRLGQDAVGRDPQDQRRVLRDRSARSATSTTRTCRSARPAAAAGSGSGRTCAASR